MLIIGVGNAMRRDDGVGPFVARRIASMNRSHRVIELSGEGTELMSAWEGWESVAVVDASRSGAKPGTVFKIDAGAGPVPGGFFHYSTHAFSLAEAVELSRALGTLPSDFTIYAVEGKDFGSGEGLSPEVEEAAKDLAMCILRRAEVTPSGE